MRLKEDVYLVLSIAPSVPVSIESDYQRIKQILINLLKNASKFTTQGFIQLQIRNSKLAVVVDNQTIETTGAVSFEVYDTGIGISKKNQKDLFKLFGKVLQKNKQVNKEGVGLGLYICKGLTEQLGGVIDVESTP